MAVYVRYGLHRSAIFTTFKKAFFRWNQILINIVLSAVCFTEFIETKNLIKTLKTLNCYVYINKNVLTLLNHFIFQCSGSGPTPFLII